MNRPTACAAVFLAFGGALCAQPISPHPENQHYFLFRGRPSVLVTSGEHYGAVINSAFNYNKYLDALQKDGLNWTRLFIGTYFEKPGDFGIRDNTIAPAPNQVLTPWAESDQGGSVWGGRKYDLQKWNEAFFTRLKDFVEQADRRGIVVEVTLFSDYYGTKQSPLFAENNVNGVGAVGSAAMNTTANGNALTEQEKLVRRVVRDLNGYDNVMFEIQNEPWVSNGVDVRVLQPSITPDQFKDPVNAWKNRVTVANAASLEWQRQVAGWIVGEEKAMPKQHVISQNYANFLHPLGSIDPNVSVASFHYAWPEAVRLNYTLNKVISLNETGFAGSDDSTYRRQAWRFMLAGGGAFNNLDYSFTVGHEDGTGQNQAPGGGSAALRRQLGVMKRFLEAVPLHRLKPDYTSVVSAGDAYSYALSTSGRDTVLIYLEGKGPVTLQLDLLPGRYDVVWLDPSAGPVRSGGREILNVAGNRTSLTSPEFAEDVAVQLLWQRGSR